MKLTLKPAPVPKNPIKRKRYKSYQRINRKYRDMERNRDIIKSSVKIRTMLLLRIKALEITWEQVVKDGKTVGINIRKSALIRYFQEPQEKGMVLNQFEILYLTCRYGLDVELRVSMPAYNEMECRRMVARLIGAM
jgi:hypothetical protein